MSRSSVYSGDASVTRPASESSNKSRLTILRKLFSRSSSEDATPGAEAPLHSPSTPCNTPYSNTPYLPNDSPTLRAPSPLRITSRATTNSTQPTNTTTSIAGPLDTKAMESIIKTNATILLPILKPHLYSQIKTHTPLPLPPLTIVYASAPYNNNTIRAYLLHQDARIDTNAHSKLFWSEEAGSWVEALGKLMGVAMALMDMYLVDRGAPDWEERDKGEVRTVNVRVNGGGYVVMMERGESQGGEVGGVKGDVHV